MTLLDPVNIQCPYCWESIEVLVDPSVEQQAYIEDCSVCCRPIHWRWWWTAPASRWWRPTARRTDQSS
ncbi:MAG: CPXCG motif-containing cysteine-rich protein [Oleiphilaceae bacterium]|nr:CPXCG motif-containing cysteine-rich protein [Oleiphilaceae bacterium]